MAYYGIRITLNKLYPELANSNQITVEFSQRTSCIYVEQERTNTRGYLITIETKDRVVTKFIHREHIEKVANLDNENGVLVEAID